MSKNKRKETATPKTAITKPIKSTAPIDLAKPVQDTDVVSFNLQPYLTPLAIIINAVIIAVAILIAGKGGLLGTSTATTTGVTPTVTTAATTEPAATTSIADSPILGNKGTAKIAIVEFSDYECPFCKRNFQQVEPDVIKNYVDTGKAIYVYREYIAVPGHNPAATTEAYASLCVRELAGNSDATYFKYHDLLYTNTGSNGTGIQNNQTVYTLADSLGVNQDQLKTCIESGKYADTIKRDEQAAGSAGVQGTPGFVVGVLSADGTVTGKLIAGAYPFTEFQKVADEMLAK